MPFKFVKALFILPLLLVLAGACSGGAVEEVACRDVAAWRDVGLYVTDVGLFSSLGAAMALIAIVWRSGVSAPKGSAAERAIARVDGGCGHPGRYQLCYFMMERNATSETGSQAENWWDKDHNLSLKELARRAFTQANRSGG